MQRMQREENDGRHPHQLSYVKKVLAGEAVHPYYYLAVLIYVIGRRVKNRDMTEEFFNDLKKLFQKYSDDPSPPPPVFLARAKRSNGMSQSINRLKPNGKMAL